ncbi:unnamed protein product [Prunus brigantina]
MRERQAAKRNVMKHMGSLPIRGCSLVARSPARTLVFATTSSHPYRSAALSMSPAPSLSFLYILGGGF